MPNSFLNNYFGFNKQQRNGLFILSIISFTLLVIRLGYPAFITPDNIIVTNLPFVEQEADSSGRAYSSHFPPHQGAPKKQHLFVFDPNKVTHSQLLELGMSEKTVRVFLNFRKKGFVFKEKKDLQKVYGISDRLCRELEPYVLVSHESEQRNAPEIKTSRSEPVPAEVQSVTILELNSADSVALIALPGIGATFAKRIIKYRSILGGYVSAEQLREVYGFSHELFEKTKIFFKADPTLVKKINLNTDAFKVINKHPYLSYELTKTIFEWRKKTSINATNLKDILNDNALYLKLLPYLAFD